RLGRPPRQDGRDEIHPLPLVRRRRRQQGLRQRRWRRLHEHHDRKRLRWLQPLNRLRHHVLQEREDFHHRPGGVAHVHHPQRRILLIGQFHLRRSGPRGR